MLSSRIVAWWTRRSIAATVTGGIGEDLAPFAEGLIAGDHQGAAFVALGDQLEQHRCLGLILPDVAEIVEDQAVELVKLGERSRKGEIAPGRLQLLDEVGRAREEHAVAVVDQPRADRRRQMRLARARRTSVILPGVRRLRFGSRIRSIPAAARSSPLSAPSVTPAPITSSSANPTGPWRCCRSG